MKVRSNRKSQRSMLSGSAAVEMAVALTFVFAPTTYGMIEMSRAIQAKELLTGAARSAIAVGIRAGGSNSAVQSNINASLTAYGIDPTIATTTIKVNGVVVDCSSAVQGDQILIKVAVPASSVNWMMPMFMSNSAVESETMIMMRQG